MIEIDQLLNDSIEAIPGNWQEYNLGFLTCVRSRELVFEGYNGATLEKIFTNNVIVYEPEN